MSNPLATLEHCLCHFILINSLYYPLSLITLYCFYFMGSAIFAPWSSYPVLSSTYCLYFCFSVFLNHFSSLHAFVPIKHGTGLFHTFRQSGRSNHWNPLVKWLVGTKPCNLQSLDGTWMRTTASHQSLHVLLLYVVLHAVYSITSE